MLFLSLFIHGGSLNGLFHALHDFIEGVFTDFLIETTQVQISIHFLNTIIFVHDNYWSTFFFFENDNLSLFLSFLDTKFTFLLIFFFVGLDQLKVTNTSCTISLEIYVLWVILQDHFNVTYNIIIGNIPRCNSKS